MKNKTAVEWLQSEIKLKLNNDLGPSFNDLFKKAQKLEKEQIINAYNSGEFFSKGEDYYLKSYQINSVCDFNYYDIRAGKCEFAKVVKGKILCSEKCCR